MLILFEDDRLSLGLVLSLQLTVAQRLGSHISVYRHDTATWYTDSYDSEDSELAYLTDSSAGRHSSGHSDDAAAAVNHKVRSRSLLGDGARTDKVVRITNEVQLRQLCSEAVVAKLLGPSLRLKPRKPLNPSISVVF